MASGLGTRAPVGRCFPVYRVRLALAVARRHPPRQRRILPARRSLRSASRRRVGRLRRRRRRARSCVRTTSSACTIKRRRASPTSGPRGVGAAMLPVRVPLSFPSVCRRSHGSMRCPTSGRARSRLASRCPARGPRTPSLAPSACPSPTSSPDWPRWSLPVLRNVAASLARPHLDGQLCRGDPSPGSQPLSPTHGTFVRGLSAASLRCYSWVGAQAVISVLFAHFHLIYTNLVHHASAYSCFSSPVADREACAQRRRSPLRARHGAPPPCAAFWGALT